LIFLSLAAYRPVPVSATIDFQPVSPEELRMTSEPLAPGAPAIILYRQADRDDNGRTSHEDNYRRIKILTEEGRKYADVEIQFFRDYENVVAIRARTIRPDGSVVDFDGKVFDKSIAKAKGLKYLAKTFTLPDVQVGSIIEYAYTYDLSEYFIYNSRWILSDELFTRSARFSLKPYRNSYYPLAVRWSVQGLPEGNTPPAEDPQHVIRLEVKNIPAFQTEDFMPPENEMKARVDFVYSRDSFDPDTDKFWKTVGKRRNAELEAFINKRKAMEKAVAEIVSPGDAPEVKLEKIYARVQKLRNTSYEVRKTEQEQRRAKEKPPKNVEDIWKRGYGNGTELTWLYLALVRATGLEAYGLLVADRSRYFFNPKLMNDSNLDANVVEVKWNGHDVYCDPGAAFAPFGILPWIETGVSGIRLDKDGGTWAKTTLPKSSESRVERKAELKLSESGDLEGKLTVTFTGLEAMKRRVDERNVDDTERKKFLEDEVKESVPAATEVDLTSHPDWSSASALLVAEFNLKVPGWVSGAGRRALLPVGVFSAGEKHVIDHAHRVHPVYFEYPHEKSDDLSIELPAGWKVTGLPQPKNLDARVIGYSLKADEAKSALHLSRNLKIDVLLLEPNITRPYATSFSK
jgi:hypothetical protein